MADPKMLRDEHFHRLQEALEEGLQAIQGARTVAEAERERRRARQRLEELNREFQEAFCAATQSGSDSEA
jgi:seryl-tRNA synthetase